MGLQGIPILQRQVDANKAEKERALKAHETAIDKFKNNLKVLDVLITLKYNR